MTFATNHTDNNKIGLDLFLWPAVILLLGLSLTGVVWYHASINDDEKSLAVFNLHAQDAAHDIRNRIRIYFEVLHSAGGFFAGSNSVTRTEWGAYVDFLNPAENYPGIEGMGVIRYVPDSQKGKFEDSVRHENSQGTTFDYAIRPAGLREAYYPVEYFWPSLADINPLGLDHGAYTAGLQALERARDSGKVTMSDNLPYAKDSKLSHPILFIFPIYRNGLPVTTVDERKKAIWGFVFARVNTEKLLQGAISPGIIREVCVEVYEAVDSGQEVPSLNNARLIYDAVPSAIPYGRNPSYRPRHHHIEKLGIDGTSWIIYSSSRSDGIIEQSDNMPLFMLLVGSLLSVCASVLTFIRKRQRQLINQLAYYDHLTGLPNRRLLQDRCQQALANAQRQGTGMALLFLDLDKFKPINDSQGHEAGDQVLKVVANRLASCLRVGDTLSRLGGDEFVVLLLNTTSEEEVSSVAQKLIDITSEPIPMKVGDLQVGCSIGISIFPKDGASYDALLKNADAAMYQAKESGRNTFRFYHVGLPFSYAFAVADSICL